MTDPELSETLNTIGSTLTDISERLAVIEFEISERLAVIEHVLSQDPFDRYGVRQITPYSKPPSTMAQRQAALRIVAGMDDNDKDEEE